MASGSGTNLLGDAATAKNILKGIGQLPSCCKYTSKGILCSANPIPDEGLEPEKAEFGASFSHDQLMGRSRDAEPASDGSECDGGFGGRDDNSLVQTHRFVGAAPLAVHRHLMPPHAESVELSSSANYAGHSPTKSGSGRGKEYAINKGSGRGQYRGRGRENPANTNWVTGKAIMRPVATMTSEDHTAHGVDTHGNAVLQRFSHGCAPESIGSGKSPRSLVEERKCEEGVVLYVKRGSEDCFNVPARRNPGESYSVIAGSRKRGSDWNAMANEDGQWPLPQNITCRGGGTEQTERYECFSNVSDQDQSRRELAAFPPVGNRHVPGRDRYEPSVREQNVEGSNLPTGRPTGETRSPCAQAKGKGTEWQMLGIEGDRHDFTGYRGRGRGRGRGRNTGGRGAGTTQRETDHIHSFGRLLVKILRHEAYKLGLNIRSDGYVAVEDLLKLKEKTMNGDSLCTYTVDDVKEAVRNDNKQRFGLVEESGGLLIRANQGHSVQAIDSEKLLERISSAESIPVCVHGTYKRVLDSICKTGLSCMTRRHIHFATGLPKDGGVISGMRGNCDTLIYLDVGKALKDEMKIYISQNGVILTEGFEGIVPSKYFAKIERWPSRELIDFQRK